VEKITPRAGLPEMVFAVEVEQALDSR